MGFDAPWHWVILALILIALFGARRLPDAARSLGQSLRIFKTEIKNEPRANARAEVTTPSGEAAVAPDQTPNGSRPDVAGPALAAPQDPAGGDGRS